MLPSWTPPGIWWESRKVTPAAAAIGAAAGEGRLLLATAATAPALLVLEVRYMPLLRLLDGRRWAGRFHDDEWPLRPGEAAADDPHREAGDH